MNNQPLLLTIEDAAERLAISRSHLYTYIASGAIRTIHMGRCSRIRLDELQRFLDSLEDESA